MTLLPALTIGLAFGLVAGIVVYFTWGYFESEKKKENQRLLQQNIPKKLDLTLYEESPVETLPNVSLAKNKLTLEVYDGGNTEKNLANGIVVVFDGKSKIIDYPYGE